MRLVSAGVFARVIERDSPRNENLPPLAPPLSLSLSLSLLCLSSANAPLRGDIRYDNETRVVKLAVNESAAFRETETRAGASRVKLGRAGAFAPPPPPSPSRLRCTVHSSGVLDPGVIRTPSLRPCAKRLKKAFGLIGAPPIEMSRSRGKQLRLIARILRRDTRTRHFIRPEETVSLSCSQCSRLISDRYSESRYFRGRAIQFPVNLTS